MPANYRAFIIVAITAVVLSFSYCASQKPQPVAAVKENFDEELTKLQSVVDNKLLPAARQNNVGQIKQAFLAARAQYKTIEYYLEYFFPTTAVMLNGAPVDEIELGENLIENPTGFQVMEAIIYSDDYKGNDQTLINEVKKMQLNLKRVVRFNEQYQLTDAQLFDAMRLEIFRITGLGITGFDTPDALQSLPEAAAALRGIKQVLQYYQDDAALAKTQDAISYLQQHNSFNGFDRLTFISNYLDPLNKEINQLRLKRNIPLAQSGFALCDDATSLFEPQAFNINSFVSNSSGFITNDKIVLGKALFNDVILSNTGNRNCASCHNAAKAFTDGVPKAATIAGGETLLRNTPTLTYAGLQRGFFYDLKAGTLEDQALDVVHQKDEMNGSLTQAAKRINDAKTYRALLAKAYKDTAGKADAWRIQHALASYIRSLAPFNSRLDQYMRGNKSMLNDEEMRGFNLFMGKAKCGSCHFAPVFNGMAPPLFNKSEAEVLGVPAKPDTANAKIDADLGRYSLYNYPQYKYAFKTPTLRNIGKTAPYMHNGVYQTLEQVVDFYNRGGGAGIGIHLDNQTLSATKLQLTKPETKAVVAFLKTLDDQSVQ